MYVCMDMEKAMATHSDFLAWKIPWTEEPGKLQSMGSLRPRGMGWGGRLEGGLDREHM